VVATVVWLLVMAVVVVLPPPALIGVLFWAKRIHRRRQAPRLAVILAYVLAAVGALAVARGAVSGVVLWTEAVGGVALDPSQKVRRLAEGLSEFLNCSAFGLCVALVTACWLAVWRWGGGRGARGK
jgi:hypothetical protein